MTRVIELGAYWAGPMVGQFLATLGCEVVKVEAPHRPDPNRRLPAPRVLGSAAPGAQTAKPYFDQLNAGKRSVTLDIGTPGGADDFRALVSTADAVIENYSPGVLEGLGLGWTNLLRSNPALVMVSMGALHTEDGHPGLRGYAPVFSGVGGLDELVGYGDQTTGMLRTGWGDLSGGTAGLLALLGGLVHQRRSGSGAYLRVSQVKAVTYQVAGVLSDWCERPGEPEPWAAILPTSESSRWLAVSGPRAAIEEVAGMALRDDHQLAEWSRGIDPPQLRATLEHVGLAVTDVRRVEQFHEDRRARRRGVATTVHYTGLGQVPRFGVPWLLDESKAPLLTAQAEPLGNSTAAILAGLGAHGTTVSKEVSS